ncbi:MAG: carbohydrate kinase family protein, partial [Acidobacteriaceae bacterium]|nr:carbohydrate kinase family protein [Acidobacteriaceae bacterium]
AFDRELLSPGGQIATALVACAKLGLRSKYIGTIGDDSRGEIQRQSLEGTGVDISSVIVRERCPNQTAYIIIDTSTGERTVLWQRDECLRLRPSELRAADIASARLLHLDGCDTEAAAYAASIARKHGIPVSVDVDTLYPGFESVLRNVDYLVASSSWPTRWTGDPDAFSALARLQREYNFAAAVMTLGERGCVALQNGTWTYSGAFQVTTADTTGAGDVFHGAFCYAMLTGMAMRDALDFSNAAAALNCTAIGARGHIPTRSEIDALITAAARGNAHRRCSPEIHDRLGERLRSQAVEASGSSS